MNLQLLVHWYIFGFPITLRSSHIRSRQLLTGISNDINHGAIGGGIAFASIETCDPIRIKMKDAICHSPTTIPNLI